MATPVRRPTCAGIAVGVFAAPLARAPAVTAAKAQRATALDPQASVEQRGMPAMARQRTAGLGRLHGPVFESALMAEVIPHHEMAVIAMCAPCSAALPTCGSRPWPGRSLPAGASRSADADLTAFVVRRSPLT